MGFHDVQFPSDISEGAQGGPGFNTDIIQLDSGHEQRIARWSQPRHKYDVSFGVRNITDLAAIKEFYVARLGAAYGFRFKDWSDYSSSSDGVGTVSNLDQICAKTDGTHYQLVKRYTSGSTTRVRNITKPVVGTVIVATDGVASSPQPTVNNSTGVLTFASDQGASVITAGFQFDVPCRFDDTSDNWLNMAIPQVRIGEVPGISIIELFDDCVVSDEMYYGGSVSSVLTGDISITEVEGRCWALDAGGSNRSVTLPEVNVLTYQAGGPWFMIANVGSADNIVVKTYGGITLVTLTPDDGVVVNLHIDYSAGTHLWIAS